MKKIKFKSAFVLNSITIAFFMINGFLFPEVAGIFFATAFIFAIFLPSCSKNK